MSLLGALLVILVNGGIMTEREFNTIWAFFADTGKCDEIFGAEYHRVKSEWLVAGRPVDVVGFIRRRANLGPESPGDRQNLR